MLRETSAASTSNRSTCSAAELAAGKATALVRIRSKSALIGTAAANIGDRRVDIRVSRVGLLLEQSHHGHHHAALTVAALWHVEFDPGFLHRVEAAILRQH